jgi:pyruvate dehydrogenase (quinone)
MSGYGTLGRPEQVESFSLRVQRAVMNGRGDEVIDLAKANLLPR